MLIKTASHFSLNTVLTIAGSDSGGSAGIQADLKTFEARGVFGTTAQTVLSAQDTRQVYEVFPLPETFVRAQAEAVLRDIGADAVKTGLLGRGSVIRLVAELITEFGIQRLVVDPVMVDGYGKQFVDDEGVRAYREALFPLATVITPNLNEAEILTGMTLRNPENLAEAARQLHDLGSKCVVLKGGHLSSGETVIDIFYDGKDVVELTAPRLPVDNPHGVGCTFASAVAAELAKGGSPLEAVKIAHQYLHHALAASPKIGSGRRPVFHGVGRSPLE